MKKAEFSKEKYNVSPAYLAGEREHFTSIEYSPKIIYKNTSRYGYLRTIQEDDGKIHHESWFQKIVDFSSEDEYYVVNKDTENRLDMISANFYGTPRYWWVIALANYIIDPFEVPIGLQLRIPPLISLYNKGGVFSG